MDIKDLLKFGGSSIKLTAGEKISFVIEIDEVLVTFNANGGTPSTQTSSLSIGAEYGTFPTVTRSGYDLLSWNTLQNGSGNTVNSSTIVTNENPHTLWAQWNIITYAITYTLSGGTNNVGNPSTYNIESPTITFLAPTRTGHTFNSWSVPSIPSGSTGNVSTTASWTANDYIVTLDKQGGSGGTNSVIATFNSAMPSITPPTRDGFFFIGYWTQISSGTQYYDSDGNGTRTWNIASNTTLYARWFAGFPE
jgi:hypothetical protein